MTYADWKIWLRTLPWSLKWFPILVVIRPIVDQFWAMKHVSTFLSPLYWVGFFTPILCIIGIKKNAKPGKNLITKSFRFWSVLVVLNSIAILAAHPNFAYLRLILKVIMPVFLFFFLRVFITSKYDLVGILTSIKYAWFIVLLFFFHELIFGPRSVEVTRGNLERIEGGFADVLNYAIYALSGFVIMTFFFFQNYSNNGVLKKLMPTLLALFLCLAILIRIYHTTSFIAIFFLVAVAVIRIFSRKPSLGLATIVCLLLVYNMFGANIMESTIDPLVEREIAAYEDGSNVRRQFNGRVGRWQDRWGEFSRGNLVGKTLGSGVGFFSTSSLVGIAVHNDFLRVTFLTGFVGILMYLFFYWSLFRHHKYLTNDEKYLLESSMIIMVMYSVTTLPTMYAPLMYFTLSVFAYVSLKPDQLEVDDEN